MLRPLSLVFVSVVLSLLLFDGVVRRVGCVGVCVCCSGVGGAVGVAVRGDGFVAIRVVNVCSSCGAGCRGVVADDVLADSADVVVVDDVVVACVVVVVVDIVYRVVAVCGVGIGCVGVGVGIFVGFGVGCAAAIGICGIACCCDCYYVAVADVVICVVDCIGVVAYVVWWCDDLVCCCYWWCCHRLGYWCCCWCRLW